MRPCFTCSAKPPNRFKSASSCSTMCSQPTHLSSSVPAHSDLSPAHSRRMRPSLRQTSISASKAVFISAEPGAICKLARSPSSSVRRRCAMAPNSLSNASANCCTPSLTSSSVTSFSETPLASNSASIARAPAISCSMTSGVASPWSRNASMVAGGMVSTVSRPMSASTYIVSL